MAQLASPTSLDNFDWKSNIVSRLKERDYQAKANADLYKAFTKVSQQLSEEVSRRKQIENENRILSSNRMFLPKSDKVPENNFNESTQYYQKKIFELESQISSLKDERSELYKNQGQNAQRLLDTTDQLKSYEVKIKNSEEELASLKIKVKRLSEKVESSIENLREKDRTIQVLQDELSTSHLELTKTDEKMKQLKAENSSLLQRWLKKMNEEAEHMNLANMLNETFDSDASDRSSVNSIRQKGRNLFLSGPHSPVSATEESKEPRSLTIPEKVTLKLQPHSAEINTIQASTEGSFFATGSTDKKVMLFSSSSGQHLQTFTGSTQSIMYTEFSANDELLLGASNDNSVKIWNLKTSRLKDTLTGHIGKIYAAKFTPDASKILSGSHDRTLKIWDLHRSICTRTVFTFSSCNDVCIIDPDATNVASGHLDHVIRFWDMRSGNCIKEVSGVHSGQVTGITVSPDGLKLLSNSRDNTLRLFDLRTYELLHTYEAEGYKVPMNWVKPCFSPDGQFVTAGSADGGIYHWQTETGQLEAAHINHSHPVCSVAWNPQGHQMLSVDKERHLYIWSHTPSHG